MVQSPKRSRSNDDKKHKHDFAHHSDRRQRFREEGNRALIETYGKREQFGKRASIEPGKRWSFFRKPV